MEEYSGKWSSSKYSPAFSRGNVSIQLPKDLNTTMKVQAKIKYLGIYRLGKQETIPILIDGKDEVESKFATPTDAIKSAMNKAGGEKKNLSEADLSKDQVEGLLAFKIVTRENDEISGTYKLSKPEDYGKFSLKKGPNHGEKCIVM